MARMSSDEDIRLAREQTLRHFRWIDGHADTWTMLRHTDSLKAVIAGLASLVRDDRVDVIVGIESRGFALAPAVAMALGVGFTPIRKDGALFPGEVLSVQANADYRGKRRTLSLRRDHLEQGLRVALVDDWLETGSQALAAAELISRCGASLISIAVVVDEASREARRELPPIRSLLVAADLPAPLKMSVPPDVIDPWRTPTL